MRTQAKCFGKIRNTQIGFRRSMHKSERGKRKAHCERRRRRAQLERGRKFWLEFQRIWRIVMIVCFVCGDLSFPIRLLTLQKLKIKITKDEYDWVRNISNLFYHIGAPNMPSRYIFPPVSNILNNIYIFLNISKSLLNYYVWCDYPNFTLKSKYWFIF